MYKIKRFSQHELYLISKYSDLESTELPASSSFYKSIDGNIRGGKNVEKGKEYYVYMANTPYKYISLTKDQSPTAELTGEVLVTTNVGVTYIGKLRINNSVGRPMKYLFEGEQLELYDWSWNWVK